MSEQQPEAAPAGGAHRSRTVAGRRPRSVLVRVSEDEHRWLLQQAQAAGLSVPRLLMESVQAGATGETVSARRELLAELVAVRRLLANVANNLDAAARAANAEAAVPAAQLDGELGAVRQLGERIRVVVEALMPR